MKKFRNPHKKMSSAFLRVKCDQREVGGVDCVKPEARTIKGASSRHTDLVIDPKRSH